MKGSFRFGLPSLPVYTALLIHSLAYFSVGQASSLLNVDFTAHLNEAFSVKKGPAAIGQTPADYWNVYSRDIDSMFNWRADGQLNNLRWADQTVSSINLAVTNAAGFWGTDSTDPMMRTYLYPLSSPEFMQVTLSGVPPGFYDLYFYAHGLTGTENGVIDLISANKSYGTRTTSSAADWNTIVWREGGQFVLFRQVQVQAGAPIVITVKPGVAGEAVMNGLQLIASPLPAPELYPVAVSTYAGTGIEGSQDGFRTQATLRSAGPIAQGPDGRIYIAQANIPEWDTAGIGQSIRVIDSNGLLTTFAGSDEPGLVEGPRLNARFRGPDAIVFDHTGNMFVTDRINHRIRKIDLAGNVSTFAGSTAGYRDGVGSDAQFYWPIGMCIDVNDNLYVADFQNIVVRKITPQAVVTTYAGSPGVRGSTDGFRTAATFDSPDWVAMSSKGELFVADYSNGLLRKIDGQGMVSTFASGWGFLEVVAVDAEGAVYVSVPPGGAAHRFAKLDSTGKLIWSIGNEPGFQDGPVRVAQFQRYSQPLFLPDGNILMADGTRVRLISMGPRSGSDGIPDSWRLQSFGPGFQTDPRALAIADPDHDGANNYQEYLAGTNPVDSQSIKTVPISVSTFAGSIAGGSDGPRLDATFLAPNSVTFDPSGRLWITEATLTGFGQSGVGAHRIRVMGTDQVVRTLAGSVEPGLVDGPASIARFSGPHKAAFDHQGNVFIADEANHRIRKIDPAGVVSTFAGSQAGFRDGVVSQAMFDTPICVVSDPLDNIYVADFGNLRIRKISPAGVVTTYAGGERGSQDGPLGSASFNSPNGLSFGPDGSLFVSDWSNGSIRRIKDGQVTTFATGPTFIDGLNCDQHGNIYTAFNGAGYISKYSADGKISWTIPSGQGFEDGPISVAKFSAAAGSPLALADDNLLVYDVFNNRIRHVLVGAPPLLTVSPPSDSFMNSVTVTMSTVVPGGVIYYTLQGEDPQPGAGVYNGPILLQNSTTVRARVFVNGVPVSDVVVRSFVNTAASPCASPVPGLVAWWPGEGTAAELVAGNSGTLHGGVEFAPGEVGQAFSFDQPGAYVVVPAARSLDVGTGGGLTIETWIDPSDTTAQLPIVEWNSGQLYGAHFYVSVIPPYGTGPGCLYANLVDTTRGDHWITSAPGLIKPGVFQHVAVTYDRPSGNAALYLNGILVAQQVLGNFVPQTSYDLYLGYRLAGFEGSPFGFSGKMDEVGLFNRALAANEIGAIYAAGSAGKCGALPLPSATYSIGDNWSDSANPNGVWAYRAGAAILPHVSGWALDNFNPPQGGWAFGNTVPFWFRASSPPPSSDEDWQIGDVLVHTQNPGTPSGGDNGLANVTWTSPANATINISGGVWEARDIMSVQGGWRGNRWNLYLRDTLISTGLISGGDPFSRSNPFTFDRGSGGAGALTNVRMTAGDVVRLEFVPTSYEGDYVGVHLAISTGQSVPPGGHTLPGLVASWSFDEAGGTIVHDNVARLDGNLAGTASFVPDGVSGNALRLDRAGNGHVNMGDVLGLIGTSFSVVAWVKTNPGDATENLVVVAKHEGFVDAGYFLNVNRSGILGQESKAMFYAGDAFTVPISRTSVNDGRWHQLVGVHEDGGNNAVYVDGVLESSVPGKPVQAVSTPFLVGGVSYSGQPQGLFTGLIDEVQIYSRALSSSEINLLFQSAPISGASPTIVSQPQSQAVTLGSTVTFSVSAQGAAPLQFQWRHNGGTIAGATGPTLTLAAVRPPDLGSYTVQVSNGFGSVMSAPAQLSATPLPGLAAYWTFDETGGSIAHDSLGVYHGTLSPTGSSFVAGGISGDALRLDRSANGFVTMGNVLGLTNGDFSLVAWVKMNAGDITPSTSIISKQVAGVVSGYVLDVNTASFYGAPGKAWFYGSDLFGEEVTSTTSVNDGQWHQIVGVYRANNTKSIYVDGTPAEATNATHPILANNGAFVIGGADYAGTVQSLFTGLIDEVQVYSRALTDNEVNLLYQTPGQVVSRNAFVSTVAGSGAAGDQDGPGLAASFNEPNGGFVWTDQASYIADTFNHRIRRVDLVTGQVTTVAGSGVQGNLNGPASTAQFSTPLGVFVDKFGTVFVADTGNNRIRKISTDNPRQVGSYGSGVRGYLDGPIEAAQFDFPNDLVIDSAGNFFITEFNNHTVRKMSGSVVTTFVGNGKPGFDDGVGSKAGLNQPAGIAIDKNDNLYVTEWGSHRIRKITPAGVVSTLAGSIFPGFLDDLGVEARFFQPDGIAVDPFGAVFVTEHGNHAVRRILPDGSVSTVAGTGSAGFRDGAAATAQFSGPGGLGIDSTGNLVIADTDNHRLRMISFLSVPQVFVDPGSKVVSVGADTSFTAQVTASGPYTFQWKFNGAPIPGATGQVLTLKQVQLTQSGQYTVVVSNPLANVESGAGTLSVVTPIAFERSMPAYYSPGIAMTVRLESFSASTSPGYAYAVEEFPPANWVVAKVSEGGVYDPVNRKVKFGPFFDFNKRVLTYEATPPAGESGLKSFRGNISADGVELAVGGVAVTLSAPLHPADLSPTDQRITVNEVTAYATSWRKGSPWTAGPNPIPIDYVSRAGLLWKYGEFYSFDSTVASPPLWWVNSSTAHPMGLQQAPLLPNSATRVLPGAVVAGESFQGRVIVEPSSSVSVYAVEEHVPPSLAISNISESGEFDLDAAVIRWGPFFDNAHRELTYQATVATSDVTGFVFQGVVSFDGSSDAIGGQQSVPIALRLGAFKRLANGEFGLALDSADGKFYRIETSLDLRLWSELGTFQNLDGLLHFSDPNALKLPSKFYRLANPVP